MVGFIPHHVLIKLSGGNQMYKKVLSFVLISLFILTLGACANKVAYVKDISDIKTEVVIEEVKAEEVSRVAEAKVAEIEGIVLFDFDKFNIDIVAALSLEKIAADIADAPDTLIILKGHTDRHGTDEYNQILSENRANAVEDYLVAAGVSVENIMSVKGYGETLLLPEMTDHENRRVIILSVENK